MVLLIVDEKIAVDIDGGSIEAEEFNTEAMEGAGEFRGVVGEGMNAAFHFIGGLIGESEEKNLVGRDVLLGDKPGGAVGENAGFAGTGAGENKKRSGGVGNGFNLIGVEVI